MPIYQYDCGGCGRRVDIFFRSISKVSAARCPECGSKRLRRVVSRVARTRSESERVASIDVEQELGRMESGDVGGFARWARRVGDRLDDELGSDFRQIAEQAEAGEDPIERVDPAHTLRYRVEKRRREVAGPSEGGNDEGGTV
jgi:putative FmdB family regulatory protein